LNKTAQANAIGGAEPPPPQLVIYQPAISTHKSKWNREERERATPLQTAVARNNTTLKKTREGNTLCCG
jgi:hypothetical protein